jgi:hypothetical protein
MLRQSDQQIQNDFLLLSPLIAQPKLDCMNTRSLLILHSGLFSELISSTERSITQSKKLSSLNAWTGI